jgi:hypothetical protein
VVGGGCLIGENGSNALSLQPSTQVLEFNTCSAVVVTVATDLRAMNARR